MSPSTEDKNDACTTHFQERQPDQIHYFGNTVTF